MPQHIIIHHLGAIGHRDNGRCALSREHHLGWLNRNLLNIIPRLVKEYLFFSSCAPIAKPMRNLKARLRSDREILRLHEVIQNQAVVCRVPLRIHLLHPTWSSITRDSFPLERGK